MAFDPTLLEQAKSGDSGSGFDPNKLADVKKTYSRGFFKNYEGSPQTLPQKADVAGAGISDFLLNLVKAPVESATEPFASLIEQRKPILPTILGGQGAEDNPVGIFNRLLRSGGAAVDSVLRGTNPMESARNAYYAPRGIMGPVEDTLTGLLAAKLPISIPESVPLIGGAEINPITAPYDVAGAAVSKTLGAAKGASSAIAKKVIRTAFGPTEEAQQILFNRPQDIARQTDFMGLGDKLAETTNQIKDTVEHLDNQAWDTLLTLKAEPQSKLVNILKSVKQEFVGTGKTKIGDADRAAAAQIQDYIDRVKAIKQPGATPGTEQFLDQPQIKNIVQSIRKDANYSLPENDPINMAVKAAGAKIDQYLKGQNTGYEEAMKPVAEATAALKDTIKKFRLEYKPDQGYLPSTTTVTKLQTAVKDKSPDINRTLEQIKNVTGIDFKDEANLTAIKQQFEKGMKANGSRRVNMFSGVGAGAGALLSKLLGVPAWAGASAGGAGGAVLGGATDVYGGPMAAKVINTLRATNSGVGDVLSAINNKAQGTPMEDVIKRLIAGEPILAPLIQGNQ